MNNDTLDIMLNHKTSDNLSLVHALQRQFNSTDETELPAIIFKVTQEEIDALCLTCGSGVQKIYNLIRDKLNPTLSNYNTVNIPEHCFDIWDEFVLITVYAKE